MIVELHMVLVFNKIIMKKLQVILTLIILTIIFLSCDNGEGLFGHSQTKAEAKANGSKVLEYVPDKNLFKLVDGTSMQVDTAWTEVSFTYHNGKKVFDTTFGYNFSVPYDRENREKFSFNFKLADTTNRVFTNGREDKVCQLHPRVLLDTMKVLLVQKSSDTAYGWLRPIVTDTIVFTKIK
jgi:hypothetical protein